MPCFRRRSDRRHEPFGSHLKAWNAKPGYGCSATCTYSGKETNLLGKAELREHGFDIVQDHGRNISSIPGVLVFNRPWQRCRWAPL